MFHKYPLKLRPFYRELTWGGSALAEKLGKKESAGKTIGETWELADHKDGRSRIANGPYENRLFGELVRAEPKGLCGVDTAPDPYPLMIKYIDARENLSIQVHPGDAYAHRFDERGKTECWYVIDCKEGAEAVFGLKEGIGEAEIRGALGGDMSDLFCRVPIRPGTFVNVPAGAVHAILGGTLLCEIEQTSNLTYRLYDWGRLPEREIHIEQALEVLDFGISGQGKSASHFHETADLTGHHELLTNDYFSVEMYDWKSGSDAQELRLENRHGIAINIVGGSGEMSTDEAEVPIRLNLGDTVFLPAGLDRMKIKIGDKGLRLLVNRSLDLE